VTNSAIVGFTEAITDREFHDIRSWIYQRAGIHLSDQKKALVSGRLASRLRHYHLAGYGEYFELLQGGAHPEEPQIAVDLLTTNETHFFREARHFDYLRDLILPQHPQRRPFRVWSAACSSGEEPYSIGMTLASAMGDKPWEVLASDLSSRVLERARSGHYPMARARTIPSDILVAHCLKGTGRHDGTFLIAPHVASRVQFSQINLNAPLPGIGEFDVIFLRNVMIYFDAPTKKQVMDRVIERLAPGGYLLIGHSESLTTVQSVMRSVAPAIYRKP
jgi:chemotaxis protein methyltransferase CheR